MGRIFITTTAAITTALLLGCPGTPRPSPPDEGGRQVDSGFAGDSATPADGATPTDGATPLDSATPADSATPVDAVDPGDGGGGDQARPADSGPDTALGPADAAPPLDDSGVSVDDAADAAADGGFPTEVTIGGSRPALLKIPSSYDGVEALPLILLMHGYTSDAENHDRYFRLSERVDLDRFFLLLPNGTREPSPAGHRFWNATGACCNRYGSEVDDVGYLLGLLDEVAAQFALDSGRVYLTGHSNGGFMSFRLACDAAHRFAAVADLAGATFLDQQDCAASAPLSVLHVHGDGDTLVRYEGNPSAGVYAECPDGYPGAVETARLWATRAGCDLGAAEAGAPIDLDPAISGAETSVTRYVDGCAAGIEVELWVIGGGRHVPSLGAEWAERLVGWLLSH